MVSLTRYAHVMSMLCSLCLCYVHVMFMLSNISGCSNVIKCY